MCKAEARASRPSLVRGVKNGHYFTPYVFTRVCCICSRFFFRIAHFTVTGRNEAGADLVLIQPFLLYYVNHVLLML